MQNDDDAPGDIDDRIQRKAPSGAAGRAARKASPRGQLAPIAGPVAEAIAALGPPPQDPGLIPIWNQRLASLVSWAALTGDIGPGQASRLKLALDGIDKGGKNAIRALDKERQRRIAQRLGVTAEPEDDGLDDYPGASHVGATRSPQ